MQKNGSRTIIHSNNNIPELNVEDFKKNSGLNQYSWIHFEGRNINQVILMLQHVEKWNRQHEPIKTSVELEKPKGELKALLPLADVVFIGKEFALLQGCHDKYQAINWSVKLIKPGATVIVAWGETGAAGKTTGGDLVDCPAFLSKKVIDTLGAGDSFVAATIFCLNAGCDLKESITTGCRVAGAKVGMIGFGDLHRDLLPKKLLDELD